MDLIDRQELLKDIEDAQKVIDKIPNGIVAEAAKTTINTVRKLVDSLPAVQPQITHCAECIHWKHSDVRKNYCEVFDWMNTAEDFCSFAERKDTE